MNKSHGDLSLSTSTLNGSIIEKNDLDASLSSYSNIFDKNKNNFSASSEISFINLDNDSNRTFTKEVATKIINVFTGKPISPNPWRKLCSKNLQSQFLQTEIDAIIPIELSPSNTDENKILEEHRTPIVMKHQEKTPVRRRKKKRNSLKNLIHNSSSSSDEEPVSNLYPKVTRLIDNNSSWQKLADVYTSEESDDNNHLLSCNTNYTVRLKSDIYTSDRSTTSSSSTSSTSSSLSKIDNIKISFTFLESLSDHISIEDKHPDTKSYFLQSGFKNKQKRQELSDKLFSIFNQDVFSSKLSEKVTVTWSGRLTATAGHCTTRRTTNTAIITLSHKVCDSPERCRDTLLHEMCHAAVTLIDSVMEHGHGPLWRQWTRKAERSYPYLPLISIRHTYDVIYKFIYRCLQCQHEVYRHSKSLNLEVDFCGKCLGRFELSVNNTKINQRQTPKKPMNKYNLYIKENFQILKQAEPHLSTPQLMKQLSKEYKKQMHQQEIVIDIPDMEQLKI